MEFWQYDYEAVLTAGQFNDNKYFYLRICISSATCLLCHLVEQ
jgi:hypothetical protein